MSKGIVPESLKRANITPIHKGGSRGVPKQYRPVALTSHIIKIFEKIIRKYLVCYLGDHDLFNPGQHGFRSGHSCLSQLLAHHERILQELETGSNVDVIYLDFAKAFDKVDFGVTLAKMNSLGICGNLLSWIQSFLTDRYQSVIVNGVSSLPSKVLSGVPQGSVLGPLLFLVLIGDIDKEVTSSFVSSFADDTRVGKSIKNPEDVEKLQDDLNHIYDWADKNNMQFNSDKFECVKYGKDPNLKLNSYMTQNLQTIEEKDMVRDLGVLMCNDGTFSAHIEKVKEKAKSISSWILRTFRTRQKGPMLTLWKTLVMPHLDYCCQLWSPDKTGDIQSLEGIQKSFINKISGIGHLNYWEQLHTLRLHSLQRRRERYSIIYTWRMLENQVPNTGVTEQMSKRGRRCTIPPIKTFSDKWTQKLRESSLKVRGPMLFNGIPDKVRNIRGCKTNTFKRALDKWLERIPDEPQIPGYTAMRRAETNSLRHMLPCDSRDSKRDEPSIAWSPLSHPEAAPSGDLGGL